ncbi:hypothetical protein D3C84_746260 [compost metagenome]
MSRRVLVSTRLSSSTTSTFNSSTGGVVSWIDALPGAGLSATGSHNCAVVPTPFWLLSIRRPPNCSASPCTMDNPRPVPLPTPLVVKNGSTAEASVASSMPSPSSVIARQM